ncbi:prepilin-type N-terminal cleavage/methylation domain-containing protein [bacterium]|nr:prepilin-type N-terminal cleavage/methylation domain-containing protein [bacterium]
MNNYKGFTLIEVMMGAALVAVVALGAAEMMQMQGKMGRSVDVAFKIQNGVSVLQMALTNPAICQSNLNGQAVFTATGGLLSTPDNTNAPTTGIQTLVVNAPAGAATPDFRMGQPVKGIPGTVVRRIRVVGLNPPAGGDFQANLEILIDQGTVYGSREVLKTIPLTVTVDGANNFQGCVATGGTSTTALPANCPTGQYLTKNAAGQWVCSPIALAGCTPNGGSTMYPSGAVRTYNSGCYGIPGRAFCLNGQWVIIDAGSCGGPGP